MPTPASPLDAVVPDVLGLEDSLILQVAQRAHGRADVIRLYAGESDEPTPGFIVAAAEQALRAGHTRYELSRGVPKLREEIAAYYRRIYQRPVLSDRVTVTVGGMQALSQTMLALLGRGDELLVPVPVWPNIVEATKIARATPRPVTMSFNESRGWYLDLDRLFDAVTAATRAIFINSPANPTGWMMTHDEMRAVFEFCRARGIWLVSDEVYGRLVFDGLDKAPSLVELAEPEDRAIITNTLSKNWAMTGWRLGWLLAPPSLGQVYDNLMQFGSTGATTFVQHAGIVALRDGDEHVRRATAQCEVGRDIICSALQQIPGIRVVRPEAAFYVFFAVQGETDSRALAFDILDKVGVALAPGRAFGPHGEGWMRLCFGVSHPTLREAARRLQDYFKARGTTGQDNRQSTLAQS